MVSKLERTKLKGVVRLAVKEAGGQENAANVSDRIKRAASFSEYANLELDDRQMPIDVAVEIDSFNGNHRILAAMAAMVGCFVVPMPGVAAADSTETGLLKVAKESTEAIAAGWAARADGAITANERAAVGKEIDEAIVALMALRARWLEGAGT